MDMTSSPISKTPKVICDWLDVTIPPAPDLYQDIYDYVLPVAADIQLNNTKTSVTLTDCDRGTFKFIKQQKYYKFSISGRFLNTLRAHELFHGVVERMSTVPYKVKRLDAAYDIPVPYPEFLKKLRRKYPDKKVSFLRKSLDVTEFSRWRPDGSPCGTYYVGFRSHAAITSRIYDKQWELLETRGEEIPPTTRIEMVFGGGIKASLSDALDPSRIFFCFSGPIIKKPSGSVVGNWWPDAPDQFKIKKHEPDWARKIDYLLENALVLKELERFACKMTPSKENAQKYLMRRLNERFSFHLETKLPEKEMD